MKQTGITIIPLQRDGKNGYLITYLDENAYADSLAGEDNSPVTAFGVFPHDEHSTIDMLLIKLEDGVPTVVKTWDDGNIFNND